MNGFRAGGREPNLYYLFTFETWHNSHLRISKMLKQCVVSYMSWDSMLMSVSMGRAKPKPLVQMKNAVLEGCDLLLSAF